MGATTGNHITVGGMNVWGLVGIGEGELTLIQQATAWPCPEQRARWQVGPEVALGLEASRSAGEGDDDSSVMLRAQARF